MSAFTYILEEILCAARAAGASDVHLTAGSPPRMRVGGELLTMEFTKMLPADTLDILLGVLPEGQREQFEEQGEYDFAFSFSGGGRCRANAYKQKGNVALALRLVEANVPSVEALGLPEKVTALSQLKQGLVLVAGASGSGKSTTLAALIDQINTVRNAHIITLENPVEYLHSHKMSIVNQREIGLDSKDYVSALRAALREDPDVILVSDLCDYETVTAAIAAAETGHLVFAGVYASGLTDAIDHIVEGALPHQQAQMCMRLANVLEAVVYQHMLQVEGGRAADFEVLQGSGEVRTLLREGRYHELNSK